MARFDLRYSEVLILKFLLTTSTISATERNLSHLAILANVLSTSSLVGRIDVALQQGKHLYSRFSVLVERIDVSVRCNLKKTHSDSDVVTGSVPRMVSSR